jgi:choice-of-anchor B domain-containing protein
MSLRTRSLCLGGLGVLAITLIASGHADDPKEKDRQPPYVGPGYMASTGGTAAIGFPAQDVQLLAWLPVGEFPGGHNAANDCWGYVSESGREYAIIGLSNGTGFVDITTPTSPTIVASLPGPGSTWRDIKVYQTYAYAVSEGGDGIQVFDLSDIDGGTVTFVGNVLTGGTSATHNVALDEDSGFLYRCGGGGDGLRIYDLSNPASPQFVAEWQTRYVHDAQVVTYDSGPYAGRQIAFLCSGFNGGSVETGIDILDVTDKSNIDDLSRLVYFGGAYSHQAWLSEDRQYLYLNDELDEDGSLPTTTFVIDVSDLEAPDLVNVFDNGNTAVGHNLYVKGDLIFEANYRSGLRVFDASDPLNPVETAYFDTYESDDGASYNGLWSNYPFFPSGTVIGSDVEKGLFVWEVAESLLSFDFPSGLPEFINPTGDTVQVQIAELEAGALVGTPALHYDAGEDYVEVALVHVGGDVWEGTFPATTCPSVVRYYFSAENSAGATQTSPSAAPGTTYSATSALGDVVVFHDDMETDAGWSVEDVDLADGTWERGVPAGGDVVPGDRGDPAHDADGSGQCWVTDNAPENSDVDGGPTRLISPAMDLSTGDDPFLSYQRWFTNDDGDGDRLDVEISDDDGASWTLVESVPGGIGWQSHTFRVADFVTPTATVRLRFSATDNPNDSVTEAGVDGLQIIAYECTGEGADIDGDGDVDFQDLLLLLAAWGTCTDCPEDLDGDGDVDFQDLLLLLSQWDP